MTAVGEAAPNGGEKSSSDKAKGPNPRLVVRNTFLELFDDTPVLGPMGGGRPRAQTDLTDVAGSSLPAQVRPSGGSSRRHGRHETTPAGTFPNYGFGGLGPVFEDGTPGAPWMGQPPFPMVPPFGPGFPPMMPPPWDYPAGVLPPGYPGLPPWGFPGQPSTSASGASAASDHRSSRERKGRGAAAKDDLSSHSAAGSGAKLPSRQAAESGPKSVAFRREDGDGAPRDLSGNIIPTEILTTVMLRNVPNKYTQSMLLSLLGEHGFDNLYDFVYLPMDFRNGVNLGYAFVNLLTHLDAVRGMETFQGFSSWSMDSAKVCEVSWAHPHQGFEEHVERYRNSPVMHTTMPDEYKPMVFKDGERAPFPPPTKAIRAPKLRPVREGRQEAGIMELSLAQ